MPTKKIIIGIEFNNRSKPDNDWKIGLTKSWIEYRMKIFMTYTLQSLKKQTNQKFSVLVRYAKDSERIIKRTLKKYKPLPSNIQFVSNDLYLETQKKLTKGCKYLYLVRLDCDDTYHKSLIQQLHHYQPKRSTLALINKKGYVYDSSRRRIATVTKSSPPFYTLIYKTNEYFNGKRYKLPGGHPSVIKLKHEILNKKGKRNYLIVVHQRNTLNQRMLSKKNFVSNRAKVNAVLKRFI